MSTLRSTLAYFKLHNKHYVAKQNFNAKDDKALSGCKMSKEVLDATCKKLSYEIISET